VFQIKASFDDRLEVKTSIERARAFFSDLHNFVELMPGVESITAGAGGVMRWLIRADVPVIGAMRAAFNVKQTENSPERLEWSPPQEEKKNLLRYSATFEDCGARTIIRIAQYVELRREHARDLHLLAGLVGEKILSTEMQKGVADMMRIFLGRARAKLEQAS